MLTKKDFEAIAAAVLAVNSYIDRCLVADQLARHFATRNPRFDRERFLRACGVNP